MVQRTDIICLTVSLPSQWVACGRIAWAFARDVSCRTHVGRSYQSTNSDLERCPILQILFQSRSKTGISCQNNHCRIRLCLDLRIALPGLEHRLQFYNYISSLVSQYYIRRSARNSPFPRSSKTPAAAVSEPRDIWPLL